MREKQQASFDEQTNHIKQTLSSISQQLNSIYLKFNENSYQH